MSGRCAGVCVHAHPITGHHGRRQHDREGGFAGQTVLVQVHGRGLAQVQQQVASAHHTSTVGKWVRRAMFLGMLVCI